MNQLRRDAFADPFNPANENVISVLNAMYGERQVSLTLFQEWTALKITGANGEMLVIDSANYHAGEDKIFFMRNGRFYILTPEKIRQAVLGGREFIYARYRKEQRTWHQGYFEVLTAGEFLLLRRHVMVHEVLNRNPMGLPSAREESLRMEEHFYYARTGENPEHLPRKRRDLVTIFRSHRREMMDWIKASRIRMHTAGDLIRVFEHYNALIAPVDDQSTDQ